MSNINLTIYIGQFQVKEKFQPLPHYNGSTFSFFNGSIKIDIICFQKIIHQRSDGQQNKSVNLKNGKKLQKPSTSRLTLI